MKKTRTILCISVLIILFAMVFHEEKRLPIDTQPLIAEKYSGWSGVVRIWIYEGWTPGEGSLSPWLNRCITAFEKDHEGVYIQPQYTDAATIATLGENGIRMPDMIIFPPALLSAPARLLPMEEVPLRPALSGCGLWQGMRYAAPIAAGGYAWACRTDLPDTFEKEAVSAPLNDAHHHWAAALTALCSGRYSASGSTESALLPGGMDLGLSIIEETPVPTATPEPEAARLLPCRLPAGFAQDEKAYAQFINGASTVMPVTQREIRRLEGLSDQGKLDGLRIGTSGAPFTDQIALAAITEGAHARGARALCGEFIGHLLSEESQAQLYRAGAFSVTYAFSGYPAHDSMNIMESFLRREDMIAAPAFGSEWIARMDGIAARFLSGDMDAWALIGEMRKAAG